MLLRRCSGEGATYMSCGVRFRTRAVSSIGFRICVPDFLFSGPKRPYEYEQRPEVAGAWVCAGVPAIMSMSLYRRVRLDSLLHFSSRVCPVFAPCHQAQAPADILRDASAGHRAGPLSCAR